MFYFNVESNLYLNLHFCFINFVKSSVEPKENVFFETKNAFSFDT